MFKYKAIINISSSLESTFRRVLGGGGGGGSGGDGGANWPFKVIVELVATLIYDEWENYI